MGYVEIVDLEVQTPSARPGDTVTVRFKLRNTTDQKLGVIINVWWRSDKVGDDKYRFLDPYSTTDWLYYFFEMPDKPEDPTRFSLNVYRIGAEYPSDYKVFEVDKIGKIKFKVKVRDYDTGNAISGAEVTIYADGSLVGTKYTGSNGETDWFEVEENAWVTGNVEKSGYITTDVKGFTATYTYDGDTITVYMRKKEVYVRFKVKVRDKDSGETIKSAMVKIYADDSLVGTKYTNSYGETDWFTVKEGVWVTGEVEKPGYKKGTIKGFYATSTYDGKTITAYLEKELPPNPYPKFVSGYLVCGGKIVYEDGSAEIKEGESVTAKARIKNEGSAGNVYFWVYDYNSGKRLKYVSKYLDHGEERDFELSLDLDAGDYRLSLQTGYELDNYTDTIGD